MSGETESSQDYIRVDSLVKKTIEEHRQGIEVDLEAEVKKFALSGFKVGYAYVKAGTNAYSHVVHVTTANANKWRAGKPAESNDPTVNTYLACMGLITTVKERHHVMILEKDITKILLPTIAEAKTLNFNELYTIKTQKPVVAIKSLLVSNDYRMNRNGVCIGAHMSAEIYSLLNQREEKRPKALKKDAKKGKKRSKRDSGDDTSSSDKFESGDEEIAGKKLKTRNFDDRGDQDEGVLTKRYHKKTLGTLHPQMTPQELVSMMGFDPLIGVGSLNIAKEAAKYSNETLLAILASRAIIDPIRNRFSPRYTKYQQCAETIAICKMNTLALDIEDWIKRHTVQGSDDVLMHPVPDILKMFVGTDSRCFISHAHWMEISQMFINYPLGAILFLSVLYGKWDESSRKKPVQDIITALETVKVGLELANLPVPPITVLYDVERKMDINFDQIPKLRERFPQVIDKHDKIKRSIIDNGWPKSVAELITTYYLSTKYGVGACLYLNYMECPEVSTGGKGLHFLANYQTRFMWERMFKLSRVFTYNDLSFIERLGRMYKDRLETETGD